MDYLCLGEPLIEFTAMPDHPEGFLRNAGGDTLNTAIYLSRLLGARRVGYLSCLGDDGHSLWLRDRIASEGIDISALSARAGARPGLSFVTTDGTGERSFAYWRDQSPFRSHFDDPAMLCDLPHADAIFLSAVALAVLHPAGRDNLMGWLQTRREQGARLAFDTNYRARLWSDPQMARQVIGRMAAMADLLMPSLDDLQGVFGVAGPQAAMQALIPMTGAEIVLTTGGGPVLHRACGAASWTTHDLPPAVTAIDTTGAGDSFNAAWLAARQQGAAVPQAVQAAARLAAIVVRHPGAVLPRSAMTHLTLKDA